MAAVANSCSTRFWKTDALFGCGPFKSCQKANLGETAQKLANELRLTPRINIAAAQELKVVLATRTFLKKLSLDDPRVDECRKQLIALKLGITADVFDKNPGFLSFASKSYLERYLMVYDHKLSVDSVTQKISILSKNTLVPWNGKMVPPPVPKVEGKPGLAWVYGMEGIQDGNMCDWTELKPFMKGNPAEWGNRYIFEFCATTTGEVRKTGDHSWLRLKTPDGDIYSVGLYRTDKEGLSDNVKFPLRVKRGYLMSPDVSEFWPAPIQTISVGITKDQFETIKAAIEDDKKKDLLTFQLVSANCVLYTKKIAALAGISLPTSVSIFRLMTPKCLKPVFNCLIKVLPAIIVRICSVVAAFFINLMLLVLGAGRVDKMVTAKNGPNVKPHIASFKDLFDTSKATIHYPIILGHKTRKWVNEWREKEVSKLEKLKQTVNRVNNVQEIAEINKRIEDVRFSLPPQQ